MVITLNQEELFEIISQHLSTNYDVRVEHEQISLMMQGFVNVESAKVFVKIEVKK